ncbi:MAG: enoyl-CoA hydratase-related protein [Alphaproteobacteria bacterium]
MSDESVLFRASPDGVATITLNRPEVHNAFDGETIERLSDIFEDLHGADGIRAVLIESTGKSFSAGADLNWMRHAAEASHEDNLEDARVLGEMLRRLDALPHPTIALVQGAAYGGGVGLLAACDVVIALKEARFALTEVRLGLVPAVISPYVIAAIGPRQAHRYMLTAERFGAIEAYRIGLVHELIDDIADLPGSAERMVARFFAAAPGAVTETKALIARVANRGVDAQLVEETARLIADVRTRDEAREGVAAFFEKRKAEWAK